MGAFRKFINPSAQSPPSSNGYVPHTLKTPVVGVDGVSSPVSPARNEVSVNRTSPGFQVNECVDDNSMDTTPEINFDVNQIDVNQILGIILPGQQAQINSYNES